MGGGTTPATDSISILRVCKQTMGSLSPAAKGGLGFAIVLTLALGLGLGLGLGLNRNSGSNKFGSLSVANAATMTPQNEYLSGSTLRLKYNRDFTGPVSYQVRDTNAGSFTTIASNQQGNFYDYKTPDTLFSDEVTFRVVDSLDGSDFVDAPTVRVVPEFTIVSGAGTRAGQTVYRSENNVLKLALDSQIPNLNLESDYKVVLAADTKFENPVTATIVAFDEAQSELTWTTGSELTTAFLRVETTSLKPKGEPSELFSTPTFSFTLANPPGCDDADLCALRVTDPSGHEGPLVPGEAILVKLTFLGASVPNVTYEATTDGTTYSPFTVGTPTVSGQVATYTATAPDVVTTTFIVRGTALTENVSSKTYPIQLQISFVPQVQYQATTDAAPEQNRAATTLTANPFFGGYTTVADWKFGYEEKGSTDPKFFAPLKVELSTDLKTAKVYWGISQESLGLGTSKETLEGFLQFQVSGTAGTVTVKTDRPTLFTKGDFAPAASNINFVDSQANYISVGNNSGSFVPVGTGNAFNFKGPQNFYPIGVLPDPITIVWYQGAQSAPFPKPYKWVNSFGTSDEVTTDMSQNTFPSGPFATAMVTGDNTKFSVQFDSPGWGKPFFCLKDLTTTPEFDVNTNACGTGLTAEMSWSALL